MPKHKYTVRSISADLPKSMEIDMEKSGITNPELPISSDMPLFLTCNEVTNGEVHGPLSREFTTYKLARYIRGDYSSKTPCVKCDPSSTRDLNSIRVREYVESKDRIRTHGTLFELENSDEEIDIQLQNLRENGSIRLIAELKLNIKHIGSHPALKKNEIIPISYEKFTKGSVGRSSKQHRLSKAHRLIIVLLRAMNLKFETEIAFFGLMSKNNYPLVVDFVFRDLNRVVEVDGIQHVSVKHQLVDSTGRSNTEKLEDIQDSDKRKNEYFASSDFELIRVKAYKRKEGDQYQWLTFSESYDVALNICSKIYELTHGVLPQEPDKQALLDAMNTDLNFDKIRQSLNQIYGDFFKINKSHLDLASDSTHVHVVCKHGHHLILKVKTCKVSHKKLLKQGKAYEELCVGCISEKVIENIADNVAVLEMDWSNEEEIKTLFLGTLENPVEAKKPIPTTSNIISIKYNGIEKKLKPNLATDINKLNNIFRLTKKMKSMPKVPKPNIINVKELSEARELAKKHNDLIKSGADSEPPVLPIVKYDDGNDRIPDIYCKTEKLIKQKPRVEVVTEGNCCATRQDYIGVRNDCCNKVSFYNLGKVYTKLKRGELLICQNRKCFEKITDITLATGSTTPSQKGSVPANRKSWKELEDEVKQESSGFLRLSGIDKGITVTTPNIKLFIAKGSKEGSSITVSTHDNWYRRGTYKKMARALKGEGKFPKGFSYLKDDA